MTTCVRLSKDIVAEFGSVYDTAEFVKMLGLAGQSESLVFEAERANEQAFVEQDVVERADDTFDSGIAVAATLRELQRVHDDTASAGCRAA